MAKKKEIEDDEELEEDIEEDEELEEESKIKKKIPKVDLNLQNLDFHQFMQPVQDAEAPVLERIAGRQAGPVFIPMTTAAPSSETTGTSSDEFKYVPTAEEGEIKYLAAEKAGTGGERVNILEAGKHVKPFEVPKQESLFMQSSEATVSSPFIVEEISARPERVDPWQAGRKDDFEKEEKKYDPDLPSSR